MTRRAERSAGQYLWQLESPIGLAALFAGGLVIRLLVAQGTGFHGDLNLFQQWSALLGRSGPRHFYANAGFADYPPGYLYILWLLGKLSATPSYLLLKMPAILADLGAAWIAGTMAARLAPASLRERYPVRPLVAAGAVLFNPAFIALSAVWGQVDVVPASLVLWTLLLLYTGPQSLRREIAALLIFAVAIAMKPQEGFVLPVMLYALYRRYLHHRSGAERLDGALAICVSGALSIGLWAVSGLGFGMGPRELLHFYSHSASVYPVTSANAFNLWGAVGFWHTDVTGAHGIADFGPVWKLAGVPALYIGWLLFAAAIVYALVRAHRAIENGADEARTYAMASAVLAVLAFVLLTRMHERYLFLGLTCLAPLAFSRRLRWLYGGLSVLFVVNLWWPYTFFNLQWHVQAFHYQPVFDWLFGGLGEQSWQRRVLSLGITAVGLSIAYVSLRRDELVADTPASRPLPPTDAPIGSGPVKIVPARSPLDGLRDRLSELAAEGGAGDARWGPRALVALSCGFGLYVLHGETRSAANLNDSAFHLQMVKWASGQIHEGRVPLDGWFPNLSMGSAFFHHYQSLAEILTAYVSAATGMGNQTTYDWFVYLLLALWPLAIYWSARLLEWNRWVAAAAAALAPLIASAPGYGYEHGSYTWRGYGIYSQEWAMWLLPLAWGLTWRVVARGRFYWAAAGALALTIACHFITGYLALLTVGVWVVVLGAGFVKHVGRAALASVGGLLVGAWVLLPLLRDTKWIAQSEFYKGTIFNDSYGASKVLGWLFGGTLFDSGRFPVFTIIFFAGAIGCLLLVRHDLRARALVGAFSLSLVLFFGRPTLGRVLDLLPGIKDIQIHRFVMGVDLGAIFIGAVALGALLPVLSDLTVRYIGVPRALASTLVPLLAVVALLSPAWVERGHFDLRGGQLIGGQRISDATDGADLDRLVAMVKARGDGRIYAGLRSNWGHQYVIGSVPVYAWLSGENIDTLGFTFRTIESLSTDPEAAFDETNLAQYQMFDIKYLLLPTGQSPAVQAKLLATSGRHNLYEVATSGYFQVVEGANPVAANRMDIEKATASWRETDLASKNVYPSIAFDGSPGAPATFSGATPPAGVPGSVISASQRPQDGVFDATVTASRPAVVLLKETFDPRWRVTVDGVSAKPVMMAPSLVGVEVPAGRHVVHFHYAPVDDYPLLFAIGALALLGLVAVERGWIAQAVAVARR